MRTVLTNSAPQESPTVADAAPLKKRVLIVGGGFGGIAAARALKRADVANIFLAEAITGSGPAMPAPSRERFATAGASPCC
jgi:NADPH-dependent 2,4-dienoyl-CoA reductase/sulfur reductase-like enzyme